MVYGKVEKLAQVYENEGGIVGAGSEPVDDGTKRPKSNSKSGTIIPLLPLVLLLHMKSIGIYLWMKAFNDTLDTVLSEDDDDDVSDIFLYTFLSWSCW